MGTPWPMGQLVPSLSLFQYIGLLQSLSQTSVTPEFMSLVLL